MHHLLPFFRTHCGGYPINLNTISSWVLHQYPLTKPKLIYYYSAIHILCASQAAWSFLGSQYSVYANIPSLFWNIYLSFTFAYPFHISLIPLTLVALLSKPGVWSCLVTMNDVYYMFPQQKSKHLKRPHILLSVSLHTDYLIHSTVFCISTQMLTELLKKSLNVSEHSLFHCSTQINLYLNIFILLTIISIKRKKDKNIFKENAQCKKQNQE